MMCVGTVIHVEVECSACSSLIGGGGHVVWEEAVGMGRILVGWVGGWLSGIAGGDRGVLGGNLVCPRHLVGPSP